MASRVEAAPLQLRLVVRPVGGEPRDVEVEAYADSTVEALVRALARELGIDRDGLAAYAVRTGVALEPDRRLGAAGLCHGDELVLAPPGERPERDGRPATAPLELAVVGGPESGRRIPLTPGEYVLGRQGGIAVDDPALSAEHLALRVDGDAAVEIVDRGSRNGTAVEGVQLEPNEPAPLEPGAVVQAGRTLLTVERPPPAHPAAAAEPAGSIPFNRPPRVNRPLEPTVRPFEAPPDEPQRLRMPIFLALIPLGLGVGGWLLLHQPGFLFFAVLTPVMAISSYVEDRRSGRRGFAKRRREFRRKLAALRDELEQERRRELHARRDASPPAPELLRRALGRDPALWERRPGDPDFLTLRLGSGEQPANLSIRIDPGGSEELRSEAEQVISWYATVPAAPVLLPLDELGAAGICGDEARASALARLLVAQAVVLHSPRELVIAAALGRERVGEWSWLKWLPHVRSETTPLQLHLATGEVGARTVLEQVAQLIRERRTEAEGTYGPSALRTTPAVLLLIDEAVAPERPLVADVLGRAAEHGVAALWLGRDRRDLPGECAGIVELDAGAPRLTYTNAKSGVVEADVTADALSVELCHELALALAPLRDTSARAAGGAVPDRVSLVDLLEADEPDSAWVTQRWRHGEPGRVALLGDADRGPFAVDLVGDGPHALVAGMTGAGKSELLQTMIGSLAVTYPPTRLTFLLVDYKGGAAFKECVGLPHTVGFVTDLDGHLAERALVSLNAELRRRERVLADARAKDLADMERREPERAPPGLAIVIDEFATLAREVPEFVDGVVDVAQRGRSLGVHLVLATQRPGGVVSDNIRANTNLRVALRVNDAAESIDVIGAADAARIGRDRPGRAFARTGHSELTEFQTAYVGAASTRRRQEASVVVHELPFESERERRLAFDDGERGTDLQRLVGASAEAAAALGLRDPPRPWLPPLEPVIPLASLEPPAGDPTAIAVLGVLDEPAQQRQRVFTLDLEAEGSLLVYGAGGSGKTGLLRTLALSLAGRSSPEELHLYGLDFASRGLLPLERLPHCGAVIAGEDEERVTRLFSLLRKTMERRKQVFSQRGVFTLSELRRAAPYEPVPRIVVLLDGYAGFAAAFERVNLGELVDALPRLVGDGRPLGVHFAISADRRAAVPNALAGIVPAKVVLRMADEDEFAAFGIPLRVVRGAKLPPGRGFLPNGLELQVAVPAVAEEGEAAAVAAAVEQIHAPGPGAPPIEPLATRIPRESLPAPQRPLAGVLGVGDSELQPVAVDLSERHFLVVGPYRSGRSTALATLCASLRAGTPGLELRLLAPRRTPLADSGLFDSIAGGVEHCDAAVLELLAQQTEGEPPAGPVVVVIDDAEELAETVGAAPLETVVRRGRDTGLRVLAACERQAAQRAFSGWLRELRKEEHGLLLDPDPDVDGEILGARLPRRSNPIFPQGRGYLVERGAIELVQVAA
jgi:DNA segregation ATPase FtsK/SpoIIIE, S-DNA-T family